MTDKLTAADMLRIVADAVWKPREGATTVYGEEATLAGIAHRLRDEAARREGVERDERVWQEVEELLPPNATPEPPADERAELVARLKDRAEFSRHAGHSVTAICLEEAITQVQADGARIAEFAPRMERAEQEATAWHNMYLSEKARAEAAEARVKALEGALKTAHVAMTALELVISGLPQDVFPIDYTGDPSVPGGMQSWSQQDEILHHTRRDIEAVRQALAAGGADA